MMKKKYTFFLCAAVICGISMAMQAQQTIDFERSTNLKVLFDAGLRPWRLQGQETSRVVIEHADVRVRLSNSVPFVLPVQMAGFSVLDGNELAGADFFGVRQTLEKAVQVTREVCGALSISDDGLDQTVGSFSSQPSRNRYWTGQTEKDGARIQVTLTPLYGFQEVTAKVNVYIKFYRPGRPMKFLTEPIEPPPGYENVSMDPPPRGLNQQPFPKITFKQQKELIEKAKNEGNGAVSLPKQSELKPLVSPKLTPTSSGETLETSSNSPMIFVSIFAAVMIFGIWIFAIRRRG